MATDKKDEKPVLKVNRPSKLQLTKTIESGKVQQNIARGRSKSITVEVRKTRTFARDAEGKMVENRLKKQSEDGQSEAIEAIEGDSSLTNAERENRIKALENAKDSPIDTTVAKLPSKIEKKKTEAKESGDNNKTNDPASVIPPTDVSQPPSDNKKQYKTPKVSLKEKGKDNKNNSSKPKGDNKKRSKLTLANALEQEERMRSMASIKRAREKSKKSDGRITGSAEEGKAQIREVIVPETISVQDLANRMAVRGADVVKELMKLGIMANLTHTIDADTAELIIAEFGHKMKRVTDADVENIIIEADSDDEDEESLQQRPPVVTIMGHVDHGKTTLLDAMRSTDVALNEAGGITQHIGAYQIQTSSGENITFLDTPGHAAFTMMRARGAEVTDIIVLVVAADDGIMPQTEEAISHAKAADVPIIVAINKMDSPAANPKKVKDALLMHELIPEELGGDTIVVEISALKKQGLDKLEETILLQSEILELKANPDRKAHGSVVEAKVDKGKGAVVTLLVQKGTLKNGDIVVAGKAYGKVRAITDDKNNILKEAGPSLPVEIQGLSNLPEAGDAFGVVDSEKQAREITEFREKKQRDVKAANNMPKLETLFGNAGEMKALPIVIKSDVQGSAEAIVSTLEKFSNDDITVKVVHSTSGAISESDVMLAKTTNAHIVAFNVRASGKVKELAANENVFIQYYSVIYDLVDDVKAMLLGMLDPIIREKFLGNAEILEVFKITKVGKIAGCKVTEGVVRRGAGVRLVRDGVVIHEGKLKTLKRFKDEVAEVKEGTECGMAFENYDNIQAGDTIEAFEFIEEQRTLDD